MSGIQKSRDSLMKRFPRSAAIKITDDLYTVDNLAPNSQNQRLWPVKDESVARLNFTMDRIIRGNAQIFYTMIYKDVDRRKLIRNWWNVMVQSEEFKNLPEPMKEMEREQCWKLGPTSRYDIDTLEKSFTPHILGHKKTQNVNFAEYSEGAEYFVQYVVRVLREVEKQFPEEYHKVIDSFYDLNHAMETMNKDKSGGDRYFSNVANKIGGVVANDLYFKDAKMIQHQPEKAVYYESFLRTQNKGNNFIPHDSFDVIPEVVSEDVWLPEKDRIVQGDSRSYQFLMKNISNVVTKLPKLIDPNFLGWLDPDDRIEPIRKYYVNFHGNYQFDSFDATEFDASTDPRNFQLGIEMIWHICEGIGLEPNRIVPLHTAIRHYLHDPTLTPWGAFYRDSTPSGHNFTGPNGTFTNMLRAFVQTRRLMRMTWKQFVDFMFEYAMRGVPLFMAVGDDCVQLRSVDATEDQLAVEDDSDGFTSNKGKKLLHKDFFHFLQIGYYYDGKRELLGCYAASRALEHVLFQEKADEYNSEEVTAQAVVQNINNCKRNPLQSLLIQFCYDGDRKYRLGSTIGVVNLFRMASRGRTVAQTLGREWDPAYDGMTWEEYSEKIADTISKIESMRGKPESGVFTS